MGNTERFGEGGPPVEGWFLRDLRAIDIRLKVMWMPQYQRHAIVTEVPEALFGKRYLVEAVCCGSDGTPLPLDGKLIKAMKKARYERDQMRTLGEIMQEMDREERDKGDAAEELRLEMFKAGAVKAHKLATTKTFT